MFLFCVVHAPPSFFFIFWQFLGKLGKWSYLHEARSTQWSLRNRHCSRGWDRLGFYESKKWLLCINHRGPRLNKYDQWLLVSPHVVLFSPPHTHTSEILDPPLHVALSVNNLMPQARTHTHEHTHTHTHTGVQWKTSKHEHLPVHTCVSQRFNNFLPTSLVCLFKPKF